MGPMLNLLQKTSPLAAAAVPELELMLVVEDISVKVGVSVKVDVSVGDVVSVDVDVSAVVDDSEEVE